MTDVIYLAACAVNGATPNASRVAAMDLAELYRAAERQLLASVTAMALERVGVRDAAFTQAKGKAIRKIVALDTERRAILSALEEAGIWYAPLKGIILKELYPKIGMRQMADNDILIDAARAEDVRQIMEGLGYTVDTFGKGAHDHYVKPPVCSFEMHRRLFWAGNEMPQLEAYYRDVERRLLPDADRAFGLKFSDEDFYLYITAHAFKHYSGSGTGLRTVLDTYVYCRQKADTLDWAYIAGEAEKLGIAGFEAQLRSLAMHLFGGETLDAAEQEMLEYIASSGTYGIAVHRETNRVRRYGRVGYLIRRAFLPYRTMRAQYPILKRLPFLLPFCWVLRWIGALIKKPKTVLLQLRTAVARREETTR